MQQAGSDGDSDGDGGGGSGGEGQQDGSPAPRRFVLIAELSEVASVVALRPLLHKILRRAAQRRQRGGLSAEGPWSQQVDAHLPAVERRGGAWRHNAGVSKLSDPTLEPTQAERRLLAEHFRGQRAELEQVAGREFAWRAAQGS